MLKKILIGLGVVLLIAIGGVTFVIIKGSNALGEALVYAEEAAKSYGKSWDNHELTSRAHPELLELRSEEEFAKFSAHMSKHLGALTEFDSCTGNIRVQTNVRHSNPVKFARITCLASFEKSKGAIILDLRKDGGTDWQIFDIDVSSDSLKPGPI